MLKDTAPKAHATSLRRARHLRSQMTLPEVLLWQALRSRPKGIKFRRQHPSGPYILDFYCGDARLAIEVDGASHALSDQSTHDRRRDAYFAHADIATLRVSAADVLSDFATVIDHIPAIVVARLPLHHAAHGPPPRGELGEE